MPQPNILEYLPSVFAEVKEMIAHAGAQQPELSNLWTANDNAYADQFLYRMTENGANRWESILGITPLATDTLEERRFRIINRLNAQLPYTYRMLETHLNQMCGRDGYTMSYDASTWTLTIKVALTAKKQYDEILSLVEQMIPLNIVLDYDLLYNKHEKLAAFTHSQLATYTYGALRDEVIA